MIKLAEFWDGLLNYVLEHPIFCLIYLVVILILMFRYNQWGKYYRRKTTVKITFVAVLGLLFYLLWGDLIWQSFKWIFTEGSNLGIAYLWTEYKVWAIGLGGLIFLICLELIWPRFFKLIIFNIIRFFAVIFMSYQSILFLMFLGYFLIGGNIIKLLRKSYRESFFVDNLQNVILVIICAVVIGILFEICCRNLIDRLEDWYHRPVRSSSRGYSNESWDSEYTRDSVRSNMDYRSSGHGNSDDARDDNGNITSSSVENYYTDDDGRFDDSAIESDNESFSRD